MNRARIWNINLIIIINNAGILNQDVQKIDNVIGCN